MKRSIVLALAASLLFTACKSKDEAAPKVEVQKAALAAAPADQVYAASSHLRIVEPRAKGVVGKIDLQRAVRNLEFTPDGKTALVAASDGLRAIDADSQQVSAKLTEHPARWVELDESGTQAFVLEHQVTVGPNDAREISPFSLVTVDLPSGKIVKTEEVGQRILYAHAPTSERYGAVVSEAGELALVAPGHRMKDAELFDLNPFVAGPSRIRQFPLVHAGVLYVPIEAEPARIVAVDLGTKQSRVITLDGIITLRGLAISPDGQLLIANSGAVLLKVALPTGKLSARLEASGATTGGVVSSDGRTLYLAQTVDGDGGAVLVVDLATFQETQKIHLDDISPWALGVRPRPAYATR